MAKGRMINTRISQSTAFASLSQPARELFLLLIPHLDDHGKMLGGSGIVKDLVVPLIPFWTQARIEKALGEIDKKTNLKRFRVGPQWFIHSLKWEEHQTIRADRTKADILPSHPSHIDNQTDNQVATKPPQDDSESADMREQTGGMKEKEKFKEKEKEKANGANGAAPSRKIPDSKIRAMERIVDAWNDMARHQDPPLERVIDLGKKRRDDMLARLAEKPDVTWWLEVILSVPYKCRPGAEWRPTFGWLVAKEGHALECLEARRAAPVNGNGASNSLVERLARV